MFFQALRKYTSDQAFQILIIISLQVYVKCEPWKKTFH